MLAKSLENILNDLFDKARSDGTGLLGVEHLLRALLADAECRDALAAAGGRIEQIELELDRHLAALRSSAAPRPERDVRPTLEFQRALQGAVFQARSAGIEEVGAKHVLVSLCNDPDSTAVRILARQGILREGLARHLGASNSPDVPVNACLRTVSTGYPSASDAVLGTGSSRSRTEKRLDALEAKLDDALAEIRDLSAKLTRLIERLPPNR